jgi:CheY-like chemotaxis protein
MATILLVDDDQPFRTMLAQVLTRAGYEVREACNGNEAVRLYLSNHTDLVITDLIMPDKEGLETIRDIRHANPAARIIAMSGGGPNGFVNYLRVASVFGAHMVLDKPFSHHEVLSAVSQTLAALFE